MSAKPKSKQEEALQFLDDLDSLSAAPAAASAGSAPKAGAPAAAADGDVLAFLDEITQKSTAEPPARLTAHPAVERPLSRAGTPTLRKTTERVKVGSSTHSPAPASSPAPSALDSPARAEQSAAEADSAKAGGGGGWGWGSVWSSASAAIQQARTVVDEGVKNLPSNEQTKRWQEGAMSYAKSAQEYAKTAQDYAKTAQLDRLGQDFKRVGLSTLTDILNVVAPPISEHEVIQVWLSYDMTGYDGVQAVVYRAFTRVMTQVEGGDLIVNKGDESRPKDAEGSSRDMSPAEGLAAAYKLAQANLDELIKAKPHTERKTSSIENPTTYSSIYVRIQPFTSSLEVPTLPTPADGETPVVPQDKERQSLQFMLQLVDPEHQLSHCTITQAVPARWLDIWDKYEWVEDMVVETLRVGVEIVGQEYIAARMRWDETSDDAGEKEDAVMVEAEKA